ncbi:hypothetical protein [Pseudomonas sp. 18175]|uniref:hypothetical protein n=1 Tax=Pseudomonas sp. 18175 TaxID=3390056 RepID=UPI003D1932D5
MSDQVKANIVDPDVVEIVELLQEWHAKRVSQLQMIVQAPADAELVLRGANDQQVILLGDERKGFKAGLATALDLFGKFPLSITKVDEEDESGDTQ